MEPNVQTILVGLILAGILWIAKTLNETVKGLTVLRTILTGADGNNGLNGEVHALRHRSHDHGDAIHTLIGRADLTDQRVTTIERRHEIRREEDRA